MVRNNDKHTKLSYFARDKPQIPQTVDDFKDCWTKTYSVSLFVWQ